jgi:hypothetical protein
MDPRCEKCVSSQRSAAASALAECPREALAARADSRVSVFGVPDTYRSSTTRRSLNRNMAIPSIVVPPRVNSRPRCSRFAMTKRSSRWPGSRRPSWTTRESTGEPSARCRIWKEAVSTSQIEPRQVTASECDELRSTDAAAAAPLPARCSTLATPTDTSAPPLARTRALARTRGAVWTSSTRLPVLVRSGHVSSCKAGRRGC